MFLPQRLCNVTTTYVHKLNVYYSLHGDIVTCCNDTLNHKPQAMLFIKLAPGNVMWVTIQYV